MGKMQRKNSRRPLCVWPPKMHVCVAVCRLCHKKLTEISLVLFIYQMSVLAPSLSQTRVSVGGSVCDCGDVGEWRNAPYCSKHAPDTSDHTGWGEQEVSWAFYAWWSVFCLWPLPFSLACLVNGLTNQMNESIKPANNTI